MRNRLFSSLILITILLLAEIIVPTQSAHAQTAQVIPDKSSYGPNEAIVASGVVTYTRQCSQNQAVKDQFYAIADLYVVPDRPLVAGALTDVAGAPNTVFGTIAGGFVEEIIAITAPAGNTPPGTYGVLIDECQDGFFDPEDTWIPDLFTVTAPSQLEPFRDLHDFAGLKSNAAMKAEQTKSALTFFTGLLLLDQAYATYQQVNVFDAYGFVSSWANFAIGQFASSQLPGIDAKQGAQAALAGMARRWQGLAADPVDPQFQQPNVASAGLPVGVVANEPLRRQLEFAGDEVRVDAALLAALTHALERYQGAHAVGNDAWGLQHLRSGARIASLLAAHLTITADEFDQAAAAVDQAQSTSVDATALRTLMRKLAPTIDEQLQREWAALVNSGLDEDLYRRAVDLYVNAQLVDAPAVLETAHPTLAGLAADLREMSGEMDALAASLAQNAADAARLPHTLPAAPIPEAGGPYTATVGAPLTLDASASVGNALSYAWDLDSDGDFDDATGAVVTTDAFTAPNGTYLVAVRTTDTAGRAAVDHALVRVPAAPVPAIASWSPAPRNEVVAPGGTVDLAVQTAGMVTWHVNDDTVAGAGNGFAYTAPGDAFGLQQVVAVVSAAGAQPVALPFYIGVVGADSDGDYFAANPGPDCDDTNADVNPYHAEVVNNGIDDDCDPQTPDTGTPATFRFNGFQFAHEDGTRFSYSNGLLSGMKGAVEGDYVYADVTIDHPEIAKASFPLTMDWGDGTVVESVFTYSYPERQFIVQAVAPHQYRQDGIYNVELCVEAPGEIVTCKAGAIEIGNMAPAVNADDMRDWALETVFSEENRPATWTTFGDGLSVWVDGNSSTPQLYVSDKAFTYGRLRMDMAAEGWFDDDWIGLALGYNPLEGGTPNADYLLLDWFSGFDQGTYGVVDESGRFRHSETLPFLTGPFCGRTEIPHDSYLGMTLSRVRGAALEGEFFVHQTFNFADDSETTADDDPRCRDNQGFEEIARAINLYGLNTNQHGYDFRIMHPKDLEINLAEENRRYRLGMHTLEIDYHPDSIQIWVDGELEFDVGPPAGGGSWPAGGIAAMADSMGRVRFIGYRPQPTFSGVEGAPIPLAVPMSDGGTWDEHTALFTFGDGAPAEAAAVLTNTVMPSGWYTLTATHAWPDDGPWRGEVCAFDDDDENCFPYTVEVSNAPPVVEAGSDIDGPFAVLTEATFSDPGAGDTHTGTIDWGDGTQEAAGIEQGDGGGVITGSHEYGVPGSYTVEICVTDDDGAGDCDTLAVGVDAANARPQIQLTDPVTATEGALAEFPIGFSDDGDFEHTVTADFGDGPQPVPVQTNRFRGQAVAEKQFEDDATVQVAVQVCDLDGCADGSAELQILNAAPTVTATVLANEAGRTVIGGSVSDPGAGDTHAVTVDWGDGAPETLSVTAGAPFTATHTYTGPGGERTIAVCATDDDGGEDCEDLTLTSEAGQQKQFIPIIQRSTQSRHARGFQMLLPLLNR